MCMAGFPSDTRRAPAKIIRGPDIPTGDRAYFHGILAKNLSQHKYPKILGPSTENGDKSTRTRHGHHPQSSGDLDLFPPDCVPSTRATIMPERDVKNRGLEEGVETIPGVGGSAAYSGGDAPVSRRLLRGL